MMEKRRNIRYTASAQIRINENDAPRPEVPPLQSGFCGPSVRSMDPPANQNTELFLKNLCINGCSITSSTGDFDTANPKISGSYPEINRECRILILPEVESKVMPFELTVELCWSCIHDGIYEAGGLISGYPEGEQYQSFADYLAWQVAYT